MASMWIRATPSVESARKKALYGKTEAKKCHQKRTHEFISKAVRLEDKPSPFPLAEHSRSIFLSPTMAMEFGWWDKTPEDGKYQICVRIHGGKAEWTRKQGHHTSWKTYGPPTDADWEKLLYEANRRVPRRLISPKQFAEIEAMRNQPVFISKPSRPGPTR